MRVLSALFLSLSLSLFLWAPPPGARSGLRMAARPDCWALCCGSSFCGIEGSHRCCYPPCRARQPARAGEEVAAKAKWARDRKNGTFGSTDNCGCASSGGSSGERHSIPRVRQSTSTQATDDENARPARHGGLHRGSYGRGAALGSIGCRVQCRYTPRVIRTPHVRVFSNPQLQ